MKNEKNLYYFEINTTALSESFKCPQYEPKDPILFLELYIPSFYDSIVIDNDLSKMQEIINNSKYEKKIASLTLIKTSRWKTLHSINSKRNFKVKDFICLIKKSATFDYAFIELKLVGGLVKGIRTLCSFDKSNAPFVLKQLQRSFLTDFHFIDSESLKVQLYGLIYPCFVYGRGFYFSIFTQSHKHTAFQIGRLLSDISFILSELCDINEGDINVKVNLSSPGEIMFSIQSGLDFFKDNLESIVVLSLLIFGGSYTNGEKVYEIPSIKNLLSKLYSIKYDKKMKDLQLKEKELEIQEKELEIEEKKIDLDKKRCEFNKQASDEHIDILELEDSFNRVERTAASIFETASQIDVAIPNDDFIDINEIMEILNTPYNDSDE